MATRGPAPSSTPPARDGIGRRGFIVAAGALALVAPHGSGGQRVAEQALDYHLFLPSGRRRGPLLVLVHGVSTRPATLIELMASEAAERRTALMTPDFHDEEFDNYQRLGSAREPLESARALVAALGEAAGRIGAAPGPVDLMGFSGGAQFVHRFALFFPHLVRRLVIAAPGWFTMIDDGQPYPYGTAPSPVSEGLKPETAAFLRLPKLVAVGADDTERDAQLRTGRVDRQGRNRLERARNWVAHANAEAAKRGLGRNARLEVLPRTAHSVAQAVRRGGLAEKMFDFLADPAS